MRKLGKPVYFILLSQTFIDYMIPSESLRWSIKTFNSKTLSAYCKKGFKSDNQHGFVVTGLNIDWDENMPAEKILSAPPEKNPIEMVFCDKALYLQIFRNLPGCCLIEAEYYGKITVIGTGGESPIKGLYASAIKKVLKTDEVAKIEKLAYLFKKMDLKKENQIIDDLIIKVKEHIEKTKNS